MHRSTAQDKLRSQPPVFTATFRIGAVKTHASIIGEDGNILPPQEAGELAHGAARAIRKPILSSIERLYYEILRLENEACGYNPTRKEPKMELIIAHLLEDFEEGKINRRQLIRSLTIAASVGSVVTPGALFAAEGPLPVTKLDHVSYTVADYTKTRDFYVGLLGLKIVDDDGKKQCRLFAGNTVVVARTGSSAKPHGLIDHIGYATEFKDKPTIEAALKRHGISPEPGNASETGVHVRDPDGFNVQLNPKR